MIILLLYGCGLRTIELCKLNIPDINCERQEIFIRSGKGDRERVIPVPSGLWTELLAYLHERRKFRGPLFCTEIKEKRISSKTVCDTVREAVQRAGLSSDITARTLRHTFATHLMDNGVDVAIISSLMGHRSPRETGIYLHALPGKTASAISELFNRKEDGK